MKCLLFSRYYFGHLTDAERKNKSFALLELTYGRKDRKESDK